VKSLKKPIKSILKEKNNRKIHKNASKQKKKTNNKTTSALIVRKIPIEMPHS